MNKVAPLRIRAQGRNRTFIFGFNGITYLSDRIVMIGSKGLLIKRMK
jgi:hypothetical protein